MVHTIRLYGRLKKQFGASFDLDVRSPAEMLRALMTMVPGFAEELKKGQYKFIRGNKETGLMMTVEGLHLGLGNTKELHLIPTTKQAKSGLGKILLGAVLIGAAVATGGLGLATTYSLGAGGVITSSTALAFSGVMGFVAKVGIMMALGGISSLLAPKPKPTKPVEDKSSFLFSGAQNTASQGLPVPIVYGRIRAGAVVVSSGLDVEQIATGDYGGAGGYYTGDGYGGGRSTWGENFNDLSKGGKGASSGSSGQESPNTLQSNSTARLIDLISEGPCVGLVDTANPMKSVYFNDVPLQNSDGTYNFKGIKLEQRTGLPSDDVLPGYSDTESERNIGTEMTTSVSPIQAINDTNIDEIRVTLQVPSLYQIDATKGSMGPTSVSVALDIQTNGGSYVEVLADVISGKTNSAYQRAYRVPLPGAGPWNVRFRRVTADSALSSLQNQTVWSSLTEIVSAKMMYPNSALVALTADARQFGTSIPGRSYDFKGRIIRVPANYNATTRAYATSGAGTTGGVWNGTFIEAWTDNPAWILYDIMTHPRYGLGEDIPEEYTNKWVLYEIAQYCDGLVADGKGGTEPRYTINTQITDRGEAWDLMMAIVSTFRGMFFWGSGSVEFSYDHNESPVKLVTKANVIDGKLNYSSDPYRARHSVVVVSWNDPDIGGRTNYEVVEDRDLIDKYGYKQIETTAWGCTSRGQAHRVGRWILDTEKYGELVQYAASMDHADVRPGTVIEINDPDYTSDRFAGRLGVGSTTSNLILDTPMTKTAGGKIRVVLANGDIEERTVSTGAGATSSLAVTVPFSSVPLADAVWSYAPTGVSNRLWRVLAVEESSPMEFTVTAMFHDPNKFARVELGMDLQPNQYSSIPTGQLIAPTSVDMFDILLREGNATMPGALISWTAPADPRVAYYEWQFKKSTSDDWGTFNSTTRLSDEARGVLPGLFDVRVRSCSYTGLKSPWRLAEDVAIDGAENTVADPTNLVVVRNDAAATTVLRWGQPADVRPIVFEIRYADTNVYGSSTLLGTTETKEFVVSRSGYYWVRAVFAGAVSANVAINVTPANLPDITAVLAIGDDSQLTPVEKQAVIREYENLNQKYGELNTRRLALNIVTEWDNFDSSISKATAPLGLNPYLSTLSPAWNVTTGTSTIVRATWRSTWALVYDTMAALERKISEEDAKRALWDSVTGQGKEDLIAQAATAAADSTSALTKISNIVSDGILDKSEKPDVVLRYNALINEQTGIDDQATEFGVTTEKTAYDNAVTALTNYLVGLDPAYTSYTTDTTVVRATFNTKFTDVYSTRQTLLNKLAAVAKARGDLGVDNAAAAQSTANGAQTDATSALSKLTDIASDNLLTPVEKPSVVLDYDVIIAEQAGIGTRATAYGATTEKTTYDNAVTALTTYLGTLTTPVLWSVLTGNTTIVGTTFRTKFADVYAARQVVLNKIAEIAGQRANWNQTSSRPPLFTGEGVTVDEFLLDPSVWNYEVTTGAFSNSAAGDGWFSNTGNAMATLATRFANATPIDPSASYEVSIDLIEDGTGAGTATSYLGVALYDANGAVIGVDGTWWHYFKAAETVYERGNWETYSARVGKGTTKPFPANASKFGLVAYVNYNNVANVTCRVRRMKARRVTDQSWTAAVPNRWTLANGRVVRNAGAYSWGNTAVGRAGIKGPQRLSWRWSGQGDSYSTMCGLSETSAPVNFTDGVFNAQGSDTAGGIFIYESSTLKASYTGQTDRNTAEFAIEYDGLKIQLFKNGVAYGHSRFVGPDKTYYPFIDTYYPTSTGIIDVKHGSTLSAAVVGNNTFTDAGNLLGGPDLLNTEQLWSDVDGAGRPADNATASDNLVKNGSILESAKHWTLYDGTYYEARPTGEPVPAALVFPPSAVAKQARANDNVRIPTDGATRIWASGWSYINGPGSYFRAGCYPSQTDGTATGIGYVDLSIIPTAQAVWQPFKIAIDLPANTTHVVPYIYVGANNTTHFLVGGLRFSKTEPNATEGATAGVNLRKENNTVVADTEFLNNRVENNVLRIPNPVGGSFSNAVPNVTGHIKIRLPQQALGDTMIKFSVDVFDYGGEYSVRYEVAGYPYQFTTTAIWTNCSAQAIGKSFAVKRVHFGRDAANDACIYIGETDSVWQYPAVKISNFQASYSNYTEAEWASGWSVTIDQVVRGATTTTIQVPTAGDAISGVNTRREGGTVVGDSMLMNDNQRFDQVVAGYGRPSDNATTDLRLTASGTGLTVLGNYVTRDSAIGGSWTASVYTETGYVGGAIAQFSPDTAPGYSASYVMAGLNTDPTTDVSYTSIDYCFFVEGDVNVKIYESNAQAGGIWGTYTYGVTVLSVAYDNEYVRYLIDGTEVRSVYVGAGKKFHFDSSIVQGSIRNIRFGPYAAANAPLTFINTTGHTAEGNTVFKRANATNDWDGKSISREISQGTAFVSGKLDTADTFIGLHQVGNSTANYSGFSASWHRSANGQWYTYMGGGGDAHGTGYNANINFSVTYDGLRFNWYADGTLVRTAFAAANLAFQAGVSIYSQNSRVSAIQFGPYTDRAWVNIGGSGRPEDYATSSENLIVNGIMANSAQNWLLVGSVTVATHGVGNPAPFSLRLPQNADSYCYPNNGSLVDSTGATKYFVSGWVYRATAGNGGYIGLQWFYANGTQIESTDWQEIPSSGSWASFKLEFNPPTSAARARMLIHSNSGTGDSYVGNIRFSRVESGATVGARAGTNLVDSGGTVLNDGNIRNADMRVAVDTGGTSGRARARLFRDEGVTIVNEVELPSVVQNKDQIWSDVSGADRPENNATNDRFADTRNTNQPPSWYWTHYSYRTAHEFKDGSYLGIPGIPAAFYYGALITRVDYADASGGPIKQEYTVGTSYGPNGLASGQKFLRYSTGQSTWGSWFKDFSALQPPRLGANGELLTENGTALTDAIARNDLQEWDDVNSRPVELTDGRIDTGLDTGGRNKVGIVAGGGVVANEAILEGITGTQLHPNPEFTAGSLTGWTVYDNSGSGKITLALAYDSGMPNGTDYRLAITYDGTGTPNVAPQPSYGGIHCSLTDAGVQQHSRPNKYARGTFIFHKIRAKIPVGRTINWASNPTGDEASIEWLTSQDGTGEWKLYVLRQYIGRTGTFSSTGFLHIAGGTNVAFTWYVAKWDQIDVTSAPVTFLGSGGLYDSAGAALVDGNVRNEDIRIFDDVDSADGRGRITVRRNAGGVDVQTLKLGSAFQNKDQSWSDVSGTGIPDDYADVTSENTAAAISGQGPGATAAANRVLNDRYEGLVRTIAQPDGGQYYTGDGLSTGQLQIAMPFGGTANGMISFELNIYDYNTDKTVKYIIGGYHYMNGPNPWWVNVSAQYFGPRGFSRPVKFGSSSSKGHIWIGNVGDTWNYSVISIKNLQVGYRGQDLSWESGWALSLNNSDISGSVIASVATPRAGDQVFGEGLFEVSNGAVATLPNFKTAQGTAAAISGQTGWATYTTITPSNAYERIIAGNDGTVGNAVTPFFNIYLDGNTNRPVGWTDWSNGSLASKVTVSGKVGMKHPAPANSEVGVYQAIPFQPGWWVTEVEWTLNSGTNNGAGIHCHPRASGVHNNDYSVDSLVNAVGVGVAGRRYKAYFIRNFTAACDDTLFYVMSHWSSHAGGIGADNDITWHYANIRRATPEEIKTQTIEANATVGARAGTNIYRADGTTVLSQAEIRTAEGTASAIVNQADWATYTGRSTTNISDRVSRIQGDGTIRLGFEGIVLNENATAWVTDATAITSLGTAAAIANQAATATNSDFSAVTGTTKPDNNANQTSVDANGLIQGVSSGSGTTVDNRRVLVGARNLMTNSGQFTAIPNWSSNGATVSLDSTVLYGTYSTLKIVGFGGAQKDTIMRLKPNTQYTISAMVKGSAALASGGDNTLHIQSWRDEDTGNVHQETIIGFDTGVTTSWKLIYQTFVTPASDTLTYCRFYFYPLTAGFTLNVGYVKLEEGNKATDWTQAPEELTSGINSAALTADWPNVSGTGRPDSYATVGAIAGTNLKRSNATVLGDNDIITSLGTASAIAGQGALATRNEITASSGNAMRFTDNLIPDNEYRDLSWWGAASLPNVYFSDTDAPNWEMPRNIIFNADRNFDFNSQYFTLEKGSTYRIRVRIWNNNGAAGWSGALWAMIHIPNQAWFSLKHGTSVNPDIADANNAIVALGDTGYQDFYFTPQTNYARQIQFRFKSTARGSDIAIQMHLSKVQRLGRDLIRFDTNLPYQTADIQTNLGTASAIAGQAATATNSDYSAVTGTTKPDSNANRTYIDGNGTVQGVASGAGTVVDNSYTFIGQNILPNSDCARSQRWQIQYNPNSAVVSVPALAQTEASWNITNYVLAGTETNNLYVFQDGIATAGVDGTGNNAVACDIYPFDEDGFPVSIPALPNEQFIASVYIGNHRCAAGVFLGFFNAAGTALAYLESTSVGPTDTATNVLSLYLRAYVKGTAPANTAYVRLFIRKKNTFAGQANSYLWWAAPQLERVNSGVTTPSPYQPSPISSTRQLGFSGELNADYTLTAQVTTQAPEAVTINADYLGNIIAGQFNKVTTPIVTKGGASVRTNDRATYSATNITGGLVGYVTMNNTNGSADKGRATITNCTSTGSYQHNIYWDGILIASYVIHFTVVAANAPIGGGGSGGTGNKSGSFDAFGTTFSSTSFGEVGRISNLTKSSGETIRCYFPAATYQVNSNNNASRAAVMKWQYSPAGSNSWTDVGSAVTGTTSYWYVEDFSGLEGSITVNQNVAPSDGAYDLRLVAAMNTSTPLASIQITYGTASVVIGV